MFITEYLYSLKFKSKFYLKKIAIHFILLDRVKIRMNRINLNIYEIKT